jgi:DNA-binding NtrC family response regulator
MNIIIVDDNHSELVTIKKLLEKYFQRKEEKCKIFVFTDTQSVLDNINAIEPDVALVDIVMHLDKKSGFELRELLNANKVKTILMSGYPEVYMKNDNMENYNYSFESIITKPFMVEKVYEALNGVTKEE